jgi:hypothetical protein
MPDSKSKAFILDWRKPYNFAMYDPRLEGFEFAVVDKGVHGARVALIRAPLNASTPSPMPGVEYGSNL